MARVAAAMLPKAPRRSLLFLFVTAEESGTARVQVLRSEPHGVTAKQMVANFNVDGINIWGRATDIEMIGYGKSTLTDVAQSVAARRGRTVEPNKEVDKGYFYRSDHFSFARIGVPSAYFKAGIDFLERRQNKRRAKASYTTTRYHQPNDEFNPQRDLGGAVDDARLILECLLTVANADDQPRWAPGDEFEKLR